VLLLALLVMGFLFWEWDILGRTFTTPVSYDNGYGSSLVHIVAFGSQVLTAVFFFLMLAIAFAYLQAQRIRQSWQSLLLLGIAVVGTLPFILYEGRDINRLILLFEIVACVAWVAYSCRTAIAERFGGLIFFDAINQAFVVPVRNLGTGPRTAAWAGSGIKGGRQLGVLLLGLLIALPCALIVVSLLALSDAAFEDFYTNLLENLDLSFVITRGFEFLLGIPVALYIFALLYGNARKHKVDAIPAQRAQSLLETLRVIPAGALYAPLVLLGVIYVTYFVVMSPYLFSALQGVLPVQYTFAEYARRGFFELCAVAIINAGLLAFAWVFVRRAAGERPLLLRIMTGFIALCTCILIVCALSKMWFYIDAYDLSRLRLYTGWFMLTMLAVALLVLAWHVRPFGLAQPVLAVVVLAALALFCTNTDALIAQYNVGQYLSGHTGEVDVRMLAHMSREVGPALQQLATQAPDEVIRESAAQYLAAMW
jgi:hypothetical protein